MNNSSMFTTQPFTLYMYQCLFSKNLRQYYLIFKYKMIVSKESFRSLHKKKP